MLLDYLKSFTWENEPENVRFVEDAMEIQSLPQTEFWQHGPLRRRDNGHFFFSRQDKDFLLHLKWQADDMPPMAQCGIMLRKDERNWFKAGIVQNPDSGLKLFSSLTINGYSDWAEFPLTMPTTEDYKFSLRRKSADCMAAFGYQDSLLLRMFHFDQGEVKAGAYLCSPGKQPIFARLEDMEFYA